MLYMRAQRQGYLMHVFLSALRLLLRRMDQQRTDFYVCYWQLLCLLNCQQLDEVARSRSRTEYLVISAFQVFKTVNFEFSSSQGPILSFQTEDFFIFLCGPEYVGHSLAYVSHFFIFLQRCLNSNPESCRSKQARYQISQPSPLAAHLPKLATKLRYSSPISQKSYRQLRNDTVFGLA